MNKTRQKKINEQLNLANKRLNQNDINHIGDMMVIITSTKLSSDGKAESFGFRFEKMGTIGIGKTINNDDGSISTVEAIMRKLANTPQKRKIAAKVWANTTRYISDISDLHPKLLKEIRTDWGGLIIFGEPKKTPYYTINQLKKMGYVGFYMP